METPKKDHPEAVFELLQEDFPRLIAAIDGTAGDAPLFGDELEKARKELFRLTMHADEFFRKAGLAADELEKIREVLQSSELENLLEQAGTEAPAAVKM